MSIFLILTLYFSETLCFWPPSYDINLHQNETFEISVDLQLEGDKLTQDEDEMILEDELKKYHFNEDPHKFFRLHHVVRRQEEKMEDHKENGAKYPETNWDKEEIMPKEEGFVGQDGTLKNAIPIYNYQSHKVPNKNKLSTNIVKENSKEKRQESENITEIKRQSGEGTPMDYNYDLMKEKFEENLDKEKANQEVLKYEEAKEHETALDSLSTILKKKDEVNCTIEEMRGIGARALLCLLKEPSKNRTAKFFTRLGKICLIWLIVYIVVAVPLWCTRGWCCCCFRCKFCRPRVRIDEIKDYFTQNPPGVVHDDYENIIEYQPTSYEIYYQKQLQKELGKLISY